MRFFELFMAIHSVLMLGILFLVWIEEKRLDRQEKLIIEILASLEKRDLDQRKNPRRRTPLSVGRDRQHQKGKRAFPSLMEAEKQTN